MDGRNARRCAKRASKTSERVKQGACDALRSPITSDRRHDRLGACGRANVSPCREARLCCAACREVLVALDARCMLLHRLGVCHASADVLQGRLLVADKPGLEQFQRLLGEARACLRPSWRFVIAACGVVRQELRLECRAEAGRAPASAAAAAAQSMSTRSFSITAIMAGQKSSGAVASAHGAASAACLFRSGSQL